MTKIPAREGIAEVSFENNVRYGLFRKSDDANVEGGTEIAFIIHFLLDQKTPSDFKVSATAIDMDGNFVGAESIDGDMFLEDTRRFEYLYTA